MAFSLLGNNKASASSTSTATTSGADTSGANLLIAVVAMYSVTTASATLSDSKSNTWTHVGNYNSSFANIGIFYAKNPTVGTSHTASCNPNGTGYPTIFFSWWSGANTTAPKDQHNGAASASGTTLQTGSITPTEDNELIITGIGDNDTGDKTISAGYTRQDVQTNNSFSTGAWAYATQTTATATNPTWTEANTVNRGVTICSFKAAAASGKLFRPSLLSGLGAGGPFFQNPLGRSHDHFDHKHRRYDSIGKRREDQLRSLAAYYDQLRRGKQGNQRGL